MAPGGEGQGPAERAGGSPGGDLLQRDAVLRALGFRPGRTRASTAALDAVEAGLAQARALLQPLSLAAEAALDCDGPEATLRVPALALAWRSPALTAVLAGAERVTLFAGTVGAGITEAARTAFSGGAYTLAVVLDACGSAAVQAQAEGCRVSAEASAHRRGYRLTIPYSPGYRDWDVGDTGDLLRALEARRIGLQASDTSYLLPEKSFCGVVGWIRGRQALPQASGCAICFLPGCSYRRTPPLGPPGVLLPPGPSAGNGLPSR